MKAKRYKFKHTQKKPARRRLLAGLGVSHTSKKYYIIYFFTLVIIFILFPFVLKFLTNFKKNYGKGYGFVPRDFERAERLRIQEKPIPFQPKEVWQYNEEPGEKSKK